MSKEAIDVYIESLITRGKEMPIPKRYRYYTATSTLLAKIVGFGIGILSSFNPSR
jgi:hypothetical protein